MGNGVTMKKIWVFGLQRSGTNFLEYLIRKNLNVSYETEYCDNEYIGKIHDSLKHSKPKLGDDIDYYILIFKLKPNFVESFNKWRIGTGAKIKINPDVLYDKMVKDYIDFYNKNREKCILVLYEDLYGNEGEFINFVSDKFTIDVNGEIDIPKNRMGRNGGGTTTKESFELTTDVDIDVDTQTDDIKQLLKIKWIK